MSEPEGIVPPPPAVEIAPRPVRKRPRWIVWTLVVIVVVLLGACVAVVPAAVRLVEQVRALGDRSLVSGEPGAAWSADGRWVFVQSSDKRGRTVVTAVRPSDRTMRTLTGYWLAAIEQTGSRVRLMPDPGTSAFELGRSGRDASATIATIERMAASPWAMSDGPGLSTLSWDPSTDASPTRRSWADASWDASSTASFRTGPRGIYPQTITLRAAGRGPLTLESTRTMLPLGWSHSGRYYAAVELAVVRSADEVGDRHLRVRVWNLAAGSEVASVVVMPGIATRFTWSPVEDVLYWSGLDEAAAEATQAAGSPLRVYLLDPASHLGAHVVPFSGPRAAPVVIGVDSSGTLVRNLLSVPEGSDMRSHFRVLSKSRVTKAGTDTVSAIWVQATPTGVLWAQPVFPNDSTQGSVLGFGGGIRVWYAPSIDATPTRLVSVGY